MSKWKTNNVIEHKKKNEKKSKVELKGEIY